MPDLVRLYVRQVVIGFAAAAGLVALLLWFNVGNLWHLVTHSDVGLMAVFLLWLFNGIVFAGVQFALAIMNMADKDDQGGAPRRAVPLIDPAPAPIPATADKRRDCRQPPARDIMT